MPKKIDWTKIETDYVTSNLSLFEISKKYNKSNASVCEASARQGWKKKRKEYREKHLEIARKKTLEKSTNRASRLNDEHLKTWERLQRRVNQLLEKEEHTSKDLSDLAKAVANLQRGQRLATNVLSLVEEEKLRIEKEKLEIEKKKLQNEQDKNKQDSTINIVVSKDVEDWSE